MRERREREKKNIKIGVDDIWWLIIGAFVSHDKNKYHRDSAQGIVEPNFNEDDFIYEIMVILG